MSEITKTIPIRQDKLDDLLAILGPEHEKDTTELVKELNEVVNLIESEPPTTRDYYGNYLKFITTPTRFLLFVCAGANAKGCAWAAKINGVM